MKEGSSQNEPKEGPFYRRLVAPALSLIPGVGGSMAAAWSEWDVGRRFSNVQEVLDHLCSLLEKSIAGIDPNNLSDSDMQLLDMMLQQVQAEHDRKKRQRFAACLASSWTTQHSLSFEEHSLFLKAIGVFGEEHIKIVKLLEEVGENGSISYAALKEKVLEHVEGSVEQDSLLTPILNSLASDFGFIRRAWGLNDPNASSAPLFSANLSAEGIARKCNHAITPLGVRFLASIPETPGHESTVQ